MLIGNPGVGKSTIHNCKVGIPLFKSGVASNGTGITNVLETSVHGGVRYMDTPGLSDIKLRKAAGVAIQQALAKGGIFRVIFVCLADDGRIRDDDLLTIKIVLEAANQLQNDQYGIIVNKCKPKFLAKVDVAEYSKFLNDSLAARGAPTTKHLHFAPLQADLNEEENACVGLARETSDFIDMHPKVRIVGEKVGEVDTTSFDDMKIVLAVEQQQKMKAEKARKLAEERQKDANNAENKANIAHEKAKQAQKLATEEAARQARYRLLAEQASYNARVREAFVRQRAEAAHRRKVEAQRLEMERQKSENARLMYEMEVARLRNVQLLADNRRIVHIKPECVRMMIFPH